MSENLSIKKQFDIFISYNQKSSKDVVDTIALRLQNSEKFKVWIDHDVMSAGTQLYQKMEEGLRLSEIVLCFITREYCESENCRFELSFTIENKLKRIFIILEPNLNKQNLYGIGILIAGSLRFNAYKTPNTFNPWSEDLYKKLVYSINALMSGSALPVELEKPLLSCIHCGFEFNLSNRVPKITHCDKIICLACLNEAKLSTNNQNYVCHFHLSEHPIGTGLSSLPEPVSLKRKIELNEFKQRLAHLEDQLKVGGFDPKISQIKNEIDSKVEDLIILIRNMQNEMHKKLGFPSNNNEVHSSTEVIWKMCNEADLYLEEIDSNPNSKRLQELNQKTENCLETIKLEFENKQKVMEKSVFEFDKSVKIFNSDELIGKVINKTSVAEHLNPKWTLKLTKIIKPEFFLLIMSICEFEAMKHLVIIDQLGKCLHLFHNDTFEYIKSIRDFDYQVGHLSGVCQQRDSEHLCFVDKQKCQLNIIDKCYKKVKSINLETTKYGKIRAYSDIEYYNGNFYLCDTSTLTVQVFDHDLNLLNEFQLNSILGYIQSMKFIDDKIFISDGSKRRIHVFNKKFEHMISFGENILKNPTEFLITPNKQYIYVFEYHQNVIKVMNMEHYELVFEVKLENDKTYKAIIIGHNLIINSANSQIFVYKICGS